MEDGEGREFRLQEHNHHPHHQRRNQTPSPNYPPIPETMPSPDGLIKALKPELNKIFKPAFLGRNGAHCLFFQFATRT